MTEYQEMLTSNKDWYKEFVSMKVTGKCDGFLCNNDAKYWYGNTNQAHCGDDKCIKHLDYESRKLDEELALRREIEDY